MKNLDIPFALLLFALTMSACKNFGSGKDDKQLSEDIQGTWQKNYTVNDVTGGVQHFSEQITFEGSGKGKKSAGGSFVEISTGESLGYGARTASRIKGTWEIDDATLFLHYDVSTLEIEVGNDHFDVDSGIWTWADIKSSLEVSNGSDDLVPDAAALLYRDTYDEVKRYYDQIIDLEKEDLGYTDVFIRKKTLSFRMPTRRALEKYFQVKE